MFPLHMQCGSAGDHHIELRTASQQSCHLDGSLDHLFKVVQQQQHLFLTQPCAHQVEQWLTGGLFETERLSNGRHDQFGIAEGCQIHKIDAIGETVTEFGGHLQAQARFAATTGSREREQPHLLALQQVADSSDLLLAPNEGRELYRQIVGIEGLERWKVSG